MPGPRDPRFTPRRMAPVASAHAPAGTGRPVRARPDANPMRLMLGLVGIASVSALTAAMVPSIAPAAAADAIVEPALAADTTSVAAAPVTPAPHVTRFVTLQPGQTAPPGAAVKAQPKPTPIVKVKVVTRSRQSGTP